MSGPPVAVAATRLAVRGALAELLDVGMPGGIAAGATLLVACSGGADSLALAAATAHVAPRMGFVAAAVVVDHGLQEASGEVAALAAEECAGLGLAPVEVVPASVLPSGCGPEAAARTVRYEALTQSAKRHGAALVLLGHTRDDQAEQVLLGLARGSGARSLAGMPHRRGVFLRPFLGLDRETTKAACADQRLRPWKDPHNEDAQYRRVRARRLLARLEADLGPGVRAALARSADLLRADADALDALAVQARAALGPGPLDVAALTALAPAVRHRVWRAAAVEAGAPPGSLFAVHVAALDALVESWHGQGPVSLPGRVQARRQGSRVTLGRVDPLE